MSGDYDICVSLDTLYEIQYKLKLINKDLEDSTDAMERALRESGSFLSGAQYDKAVAITGACIRQTRVTGLNVNRAIKYLEDLQNILIEYGHCIYNGE